MSRRSSPRGPSYYVAPYEKYKDYGPTHCRRHGCDAEVRWRTTGGFCLSCYQLHRQGDDLQRKQHTIKPRCRVV